MKKFLFSFVFVSSTLIGFSQTPCPSSFNVINNGGGACDNKFPGNGLEGADVTFSRSGYVEIRFASQVEIGTDPVITAIREITSPVGASVTTYGPDLVMKFKLKGFITGTNNTEAEYCYYSKNNLNLNNAFGSRYQVDVTFVRTGGPNVDATCNITQRPDAIGLPVTFGAFAAERKSMSSVFLRWTTLSELNNKGFYVQRNVGGVWKNAGFVFSQTANGYSSSSLTYEFKDVNQEKATTQYRILQVDNDGNGKYSDIRLVRGEANSGKVVLYPNPTSNGKVSIAFEGNGERDIMVHDMSGRVVKQLTNITSSNVVIDGLQSGFYTIQMVDRNTNTVSREKLVVNNK